MPELRKVIMMGKKRPFDEERWKQLLTALTPVLYERRQARHETSVNTKPESGAGPAP